MKREEELHHPSLRLSDDELLFRLRHIAAGRCGNATVDSALGYAIADGSLTHQRANALRQALIDEGVVDEKTSAPRPGTVNHSAEHPRLDQRCNSCGYGVDSRGHYIQCGGEK